MKVHCIVPSQSCYYDFMVCRLAALHRILRERDLLNNSGNVIIWSEDGDFVGWLELFSHNPIRTLSHLAAPPENALCAIDPNPELYEDFIEQYKLAEHLLQITNAKSDVLGVTLIRRSGTRKYSHHAELLERLRLEGLNVREACMESLSPAQQIELMRSTHILIGPHGSGHANGMFMPAGGLLFELFPKGFYTDTYRKMAGVFDQSWDMIESEAAPSGTKPIPKRLADFLCGREWPVHSEVKELMRVDIDVLRCVRDVGTISLAPEIIVRHLKEHWKSHWNACRHTSES